MLKGSIADYIGLAQCRVEVGIERYPRSHGYIAGNIEPSRRYQGDCNNFSQGGTRRKRE